MWDKAVLLVILRLVIKTLQYKCETVVNLKLWKQTTVKGGSVNKSY